MTEKPLPRQGFWNATIGAWWSRLSPQRQDQFASVVPLLAVLLFLLAVAAIVGYLRTEELQTESQAIQRDGEYSRQRLNVRLAERQDMIQKFGRELVQNPPVGEAFDQLAEKIVSETPEMRDITWLDADGVVQDSRDALGMPSDALPQPHQPLALEAEKHLISAAADMQQPIYGLVTSANHGEDPWLGLVLPLYQKTTLKGYLYVRYTLVSLMYYGVPSDIYARYSVSLVDREQKMIVGQETPPASDRGSWHRSWLAPQPRVFSAPLAPLGNDLALQLYSSRHTGGVASNGLMLMVLALSALTAWMLTANWRHLRRRMRSQQALMAETSFRRAMEDSLAIGMRALDMEGRISHVNAAFSQMTGWSEEELVGQMPPYSFWHAEDYQRHQRILEQTLQNKYSQGGYEMRVLRKNGTTFEARIYMSPLMNTDGKQTGWISSMTDITEPNRVKRQLTSAYERFTRVLNSMDTAISVAPLGGKELLFANKTYRQWFGGEDNAVGHLRMLNEAGSLERSNDMAAEAEDVMAGLPVTELPDAATNNREIYLPDLDKWIEVRSRYLEWVDGRLAQMLIATDITARRHAEQLSAQQEARAQTVSRLVTMGEMASSVAHELNQPLTAINNYCNGMISRIQQGQIDNAALLGALEKTSRQAQRAGQVIQRIRSFVKRSASNYSPADVDTIVLEALELADIELRRRNVRLHSHVQPELPELLVDKILIEQVLINLLKNAGEAIDQAAMPAARREIRLDVGHVVRDGRHGVEFAIRDKGNGLSEEAMEHLFEAFYTTKPEGMGIGLNLCRSIVEAHQGRLDAENLYNGTLVAGCCFTFWLPIPPQPVPA